MKEQMKILNSRETIERAFEIAEQEGILFFREVSSILPYIDMVKLTENVKAFKGKTPINTIQAELQFACGQSPNFIKHDTFYGSFYDNKKWRGGWALLRNKKHLINSFKDNYSNSTNIIRDLTFEKIKKINEENKKSISDPKISISTVELHKRSRNSKLKEYVLQEFDGSCSNCGKDKTFISKAKESQYFEVHHIQEFNGEWNDTLENMAPLCPQCHKEAHFGKYKEEIYNKLLIIDKPWVK